MKINQYIFTEFLKTNQLFSFNITSRYASFEICLTQTPLKIGIKV